MLIYPFSKACITQFNIYAKIYIYEMYTYMILCDITLYINNDCSDSNVTLFFLSLNIYKCIYVYIFCSRDSVVGIVTGYWLDDREPGIRVPVGLRMFSPPRRPDRFWGPPNLLSIG
jgi:hypothetical protein